MTTACEIPMGDVSPYVSGKKRRLDMIDESVSFSIKRTKLEQAVEEKNKLLASLTKKVISSSVIFGQSVDEICDFLKVALPLHLSEYALHDYNMTQYAHSGTLKQDGFYENVNLVHSSSSFADNTTTYIIIFEASLPADETTETFITKISVSFSDPPVKICFRSVKITGKESDYEDNDDDEGEEDNLSDSYEDDPNIDSDSDVEDHSQKTLLEDSESVVEDHSQKILLQFQKKDTQENISSLGDRVHGKSLGSLSESESEKKDTRTGVRYYCHVDTHFTPMEQKYKGSELSKEIESFRRDVAKSDGFEVGHYPLMDAAGIRGTWIFKFYDRENKPLGPTDMKELVCLSRLAICIYNMKKNTRFGNVKVLKAMTFGGTGVGYNITFKASLPDKSTEIFQTRILADIPLPYAKIEIEFVKVKPK